LTGIVDVFGGAGNVIFNIPKEWKVTRVYNDLDKRLYTTIKVMTDANKRMTLLDMVEHTMNSRDLFEECKEFFKSDLSDKGDIEIAYHFIVGSLLSFNGNMKNYAQNKYFGHVQAIGGYSQKLKKSWDVLRLNYIVENLPFEKLIEKNNRNDIFLYLDPPYLKGGRNYKLSFNKEDFYRLAECLKTFKGKWMLNESEVDFPFIEEVFGKPYFTKSYVSFAVKADTDGTKSKRLEGYWGNYRV
jgi:site-specific DNA-adenine methylase